MKHLHGLRHKAKIGEYVADTKSDPEWVFLTLNGVALLRQAKISSGKFFRQGTNPDYTGYDGFPVEYLRDGQWRVWDTQASKGMIRKEHKRILKG